MKKFAVVLLASVALASCAYAPGALAATECAGTQTECLNAWFDARFAEELAFSPMRQTQLGMKTDYDKLDDMSVEAAKRQIDWWQQAAAQMTTTFDYDALSDEEKLSYDMFKFRAATAARSGRFMEQQYVLHQFNGSQSTLPAFLLSQHKVETESDMVAFIARFGALCPVIDQLLGTSAGQCRCRHKAAALFLRRCNRRIDETGPGCPVRQWTGVSALGRK